MLYNEQTRRIGTLSVFVCCFRSIIIVYEFAMKLDHWVTVVWLVRTNCLSLSFLVRIESKYIQCARASIASIIIMTITGRARERERKRWIGSKTTKRWRCGCPDPTHSLTSQFEASEMCYNFPCDLIVHRSSRLSNLDGAPKRKKSETKNISQFNLCRWRCWTVGVRSCDLPVRPSVRRDVLPINRF